MSSPQTPAQSAHPYIIIAGHGRSGSNRLLDAFDCHPQTLCRNEPNETRGSVFNELPPGFFPAGENPGFIDRWRKIIAIAATEISERDRIGERAKDYIASPANRLFARRVLARRRIRGVLGSVWPNLRGEQWSAAPYLANHDRLAGALPVFKMLLCQGWLIDAFEREPEMRVIHNIRAPKPFLISWRRRYVEPTGPQKVFEDNLRELQHILDYFGRKSLGTEDFSEEALFETELWRWRFVNEALHRACNGKPRYAWVTYDAFEKNPVGEAERLYAFAGLDLNDAVRAEIATLENKLFRPQPATAKDEFDFLDDIIEDVLDGSDLMAVLGE